MFSIFANTPPTKKDRCRRNTLLYSVTAIIILCGIMLATSGALWFVDKYNASSWRYYLYAASNIGDFVIILVASAFLIDSVHRIRKIIKLVNLLQQVNYSNMVVHAFSLACYLLSNVIYLVSFFQS